jgi:enediyne polyketide synthase
VILGNTLTGEFTRSNQMLLRWPYVRKALRASAKQKGLTHLADELENTMEEYYKSVFAPVNEDTLAGGLANTIAGRICNYLDIHGGGYIVDGACSSSLLAIVTAANYLELGQMDVVIAGGIDISLDTFELVGFSKTGALTPDEMRVYDKAGKGFLPGEGCGMVILKRLEDALRDHDQVYATLSGWAISSDGKGGITAPSASGQSRALIRAYEKAKFDPAQIDFIEGHGTGTTVGDKVELEGITIALNNNREIPQRNCGVTSFKSIVGHTKAAAGVGAFIKTVMAVNQRILPPTAGLKDFNAIFEDKAKSLYPICHGQARDPLSTLFAGVSAMGFGGINSHVLLQSGNAPSQKLHTGMPARKLMVSNQSHELFLFSATSSDELVDVLLAIIKDAAGMSYAELVDLACLQNGKIDFSKPIRAAIIADTPVDLERKLNILLDKVKDWNNGKQITLENNTVVAGYKLDNPKIGALYPGQGSQKLNMTYKLIERHDWLMETVQKAGETFASAGTDNVIPSV